MIGLVTFIVVSYISARDWTSVGLLLGYFSAYLICIPCGVFLTPYLMKYFHYFKSIDTFAIGSTSWIRVGGRLIKASDPLDQRSDQRDIDSQIVTVDQFAAAMTSIQEAIASLDRRIDGQQAQEASPQDDAQYDPIVPPSSPPSQSTMQTIPFTLHS